MASIRRLPSASFCLDPCHHCALVIGHPGHELKVFGWISEYKPRVYVITDGSGRSGISRISSTTALLSSLGASLGEPFGAMSDAQIYQAILEQDTSCFFKIVDELACSFVRHDIDCVAGDSAEGFNPTHDLCRVLINAAIARAERISGKNIANFGFSLTEWEPDCPESPHDERCLHWILDEQLLSEKIAAAQQYVELKNDVQRAIARRGEEYFRRECIRPVFTTAPRFDSSRKPFYETWGERQVLNGEYQSVIRLEQHIMPLANAIFDYALQADSNSLVVPRAD